jgi:hypothetical protein
MRYGASASTSPHMRIAIAPHARIGNALKLYLPAVKKV